MRILKISNQGLLGILGAFAIALTCSASGEPAGPYTGEDATGEKVMGLWQFDPEAPAVDRAAHGHSLELRGEDSRFVADGKFSGALEIVEDREPGDTRQGASAGNAPTLSPEGAFTLEMWIQPNEELLSRKMAFLLDKNSSVSDTGGKDGHRDYMLLLRASGSDNQFRLEARLGFGHEAEVIQSAPFGFDAGVWYHVAFTYNGRGDCLFFLNGAHLGGRQLENRGALSPGKKMLVIGDRVGSRGQRFLGKISEVRISAEAIPFGPPNLVSVSAEESRTAFYRMEQNARFRIKVGNRTKGKLEGTEVRLNGKIIGKPVVIPEMEGEETVEVEIPISTELKPGEYPMAIELLNAGGKPLCDPVPITATIVARPLPHQMPVVMAGLGDMDTIKEAGFTHYYAIWQSMQSPPVEFLKPASILDRRKRLDRALALQIGAVAGISSGRSHEHKATYHRLDRKGKVYPTLNGLMPEAQEAARALGAFTAKHFGDLPAFQGAMIDSEMRDHSRPSFHPVDIQAYRKFSGREIPEIVGENARGVSYKKVAGFPGDRIIPDDEPILEYFRWFWKEGNGWSRIHSLTVEGLKSTGRNDIWTYHQPAVRGPSVYGSGGAVDYLSQWTYTSPDPLRINLAGDELIAMAAGRPGQQIMNMTQVFWYRSQVAPIPKKGEAPVANRAQWEEREPEAKFITISPDHLSETLWLKLSQPIKGVLFHGWESLIGGRRTGYIKTHSETLKRLSSMISSVVKPLGPTLKQIPDAVTDVAFLESFASQTFAGRGTFGWGRGWEGDAYLIARYAGLQPKIVYDETVIKDGLDAYTILFVPHCDVVTSKVAAEILKFQQKGGLVIGDEFLAPGLQPDILMASFRRSGDAEKDKAELLRKTEELKRELAPFYQWSFSSDNPEVILRSRGSGEVLFAVNDRREFGDYVGHHRLVMERGLPVKATVTWKRPNGVVYDLTQRRIVPTMIEEGALMFPIELEAGEGALFYALDEAAGDVQIEAPQKVKQGERAVIDIRLRDIQDRPLKVVVPMQVIIRDADGKEAEQTGYYGAANGILKLILDIAPNDGIGKWQVEVTEGLTGKRTTHDFFVN